MVNTPVSKEGLGFRSMRPSLRGHQLPQCWSSAWRRTITAQHKIICQHSNAGSIPSSKASKWNCFLTWKSVSAPLFPPRALSTKDHQQCSCTFAHLAQGRPSRHNLGDEKEKAQKQTSHGPGILNGRTGQGLQS